jgi:ABC-type spermidine/putrescine transport system permease subunit II
MLASFDMFDLAWLLAQQTEPLIRRLEPQMRAKVLAALAALIILGFGMIALVWLGGRATRRYMGIEPKPRRRDREINSDDWAHKPIVPPLDEATAPEHE